MRVFFDIDGCLSDDSHRVHLHSAGLYDEYHNNAVFDEPINWDVVKCHVEQGDAISFLTGRPANYVWPTIEWLRAQMQHHDVWCADWSIHMRPLDNKQLSSEYKRDAINAMLQRGELERGEVLVYDDREFVVDELNGIDGVRALRLHKFSSAKRRVVAGSAKLFFNEECSPFEVKSNFDFSDLERDIDAAFDGALSSCDCIKYTTLDGQEVDVCPEHEMCGDYPNCRCPSGEPRVSEILHEAATTFAERNGVYKSNYRQVAAVMQELFPDGVPDGLVFQPQWHLFELIIVKLTRFANTNLMHKDSMRDSAVYCAMIESLIEEQEQ